MVKHRAVVLHPNGVCQQVEIDQDVSAYQRVVGGYIQGVFGPNTTIYVNEEGLFLDLPFNSFATEAARKFCGLDQPLYGTALVLGPPDNAGNDTHVHPDVVKHLNMED